MLCVEEGPVLEFSLVSLYFVGVNNEMNEQCFKVQTVYLGQHSDYTLGISMSACDAQFLFSPLFFTQQTALICFSNLVFKADSSCL